MRILVGALCAVCVLAHADDAIDEHAARPAPAAHVEVAQPNLCASAVKAEIYARTELLFGLSRANGPKITEPEFQNFIDAEVTPRFPDGLTLLTANGQWQDATGKTIREGSKLLILLYPFSEQRSRLIEEVRRAYKSSFRQESVLRIDEYSCVSF
jgi:hypothetical protein